MVKINGSLLSIVNFSKHERQSLLESSLIQLPKSVPQSNESLFMTSVEKARIRNDALLKVTFALVFLFFKSLTLSFSL